MPASRLLIKRTFVIALASVVILAGLLVGGVRLIDHLMPGYREALAERIGGRIDANIDIGAIELRWQWRGPLLELADVRIVRRGSEKPAVTLDSLGLHFSFNDLINGKRLPDGLVLERPELALRRGEDGRPQVEHWSRPGDEPLDWGGVNDALQMMHSVQVDDARITLRDDALPEGQAVIEQANASIVHGENGYDWQASANGPDWFESIDGEGRFSGTLPVVDTADFSLSLSGVQALMLARTAELLGPNLSERLSGGELSTTVEGQWRHGRLTTAQADIDLAAVRDSDHDEPLLPELSTTLKAAGMLESATATAGVGAGPDDFSIVVSRLEGALDGLDAFSLTGAVDIDEPSLQLDARHVPVPLALRLARLKFERLARSEIDARVDDLSFAIGADTPARLAFDFKDLSIADPAVTVGPLAGSYYQQADTHRLTFSNAGGTLTVPRFLRGELPLDDLDGELSWRENEIGWQVDARTLKVASGEAQLQASGNVTLPRNGAPKVDIDARASAPEAARLLQYIPQAEDLPNERLRDWLPKAITAGTLDSARLQIAGALDRFPFEDPREGERFTLELTGHGVDVTYKDDWPALDNARGKLVLDGDDLRVDVAEAAMLGVALGPATGRVANVREPVLLIDGKASNGEAKKMLSFLSKSPLRDRFDKVLEAIDVSGPADLTLDLRIPLKPGLGDLAVAGTVDARGATLRQDALPGPITGITGRLRFDAAGLHAKGLQGDMLGVALDTDLEPVGDDRQRITSRARLELPRDGEAVSRYLPKPWLRYANGVTDLDVAFEVARDGGLSDIKLTSDLAGMALTLPDPLTKPAGKSAPLAITIAGNASRIDIDYDQRADVDVRLVDGKTTRVQAIFNDETLEAPDVDGIWIGGHTDSADGLGWFTVVRDQVQAALDKAAAGGSASALEFTGGDLTVGELNLDNRYFENAQLRAQTMSAQPGWRIDFEGPNTQGQVTWTQPRGGNINIAGNLAKLALKTRDDPPAPAEDDESTVMWEGVSPVDLPHLDIFVGNVLVDAIDFGTAEVNASALPNGWQLDRFKLSDGALTGWATGQWLRDDGMTRATAQTRLEGHGLSGLLRSLGYASTVRAETARIHARLDIAPNPAGLDLRALDGDVQIALDDGTFTAVEPGAARVLGLVNLYVLPRRLRLDFRDVVDEGLAFDKVRANFKIDNGDAYSDSVRIETPSSKIVMSGRIGLADRDYDEQVQITPKVGSGVTIASTVLGGPLVGAAVFAMQELLKKPIQKFSSITYTLKGSWDDPRIEEPRAEE
ncbi:hypothetical protein SADO_16343 [Salinisphaera dokdonensis CL-ES53]|uniref:YhdP central domain-containing protein n=1 Tax=Salinisphaera dokdonensis CL-ES53 TaxID=1304272 RepID=A0ABV2B4L6_9GAMM